MKLHSNLIRLFSVSSSSGGGGTSKFYLVANAWTTIRFSIVLVSMLMRNMITVRSLFYWRPALPLFRTFHFFVMLPLVLPASLGGTAYIIKHNSSSSREMNTPDYIVPCPKEVYVRLDQGLPVTFPQPMASTRPFQQTDDARPALQFPLCLSVLENPFPPGLQAQPGNLPIILVTVSAVDWQL